MLDGEPDRINPTFHRKCKLFHCKPTKGFKRKKPRPRCTSSYIYILFFQATPFCSSYFQPVALRDPFCWVMTFTFPDHVVLPFLLLSLFMINYHHVPDHHDHLLSLCCRDQTLLGADIDFYNWENFQSVNYLNFNPLYTKTIYNQGRI